MKTAKRVDKKLLEVKKLLSQMDPEMVKLAIQYKERNEKEVAEIKKLLSKYNPRSVQFAVHELSNETFTKEFRETTQKFSKYEHETLVNAAADLGMLDDAYLDKIFRCLDGLNCRQCIQVMVGFCTTSLVSFEHPFDQVVNDPQVMESAVTRGVLKAFEQLGQNQIPIEKAKLEN